jgi:hypothetical protein
MKTTYDPPPAPRSLLGRLMERVIAALSALLTILLPRSH